MNAAYLIKTAEIDRLDAELIVAHVIGQNRIFLHAHPEYELSPDELKRARMSINRRAMKEPLAYIIGQKEFYGRKFDVDFRTLIPRPETEALVAKILELKPKTMLDVGTGSGCIAISAKLELPSLDAHASDVSPYALIVAKQNAKKLGANITFHESYLFKKLPKTAKFDLIAANLPYVDRKWNWLSPELAFEPESALYAEDDGLSLIKECIDAAPNYLNPGGYLLLEADRSQHEKIASYASDYFENLTDPSDQTLALCLCLRQKSSAHPEKS